MAKAASTINQQIKKREPIHVVLYVVHTSVSFFPVSYLEKTQGSNSQVKDSYFSLRPAFRRELHLA